MAKMLGLADETGHVAIPGMHRDVDARAKSWLTEYRAKQKVPPATQPGFFEQPHVAVTGNPLIDVPLTKTSQGVIGGIGSAIRGAGQIIEDPASALDLLTPAGGLTGLLPSPENVARKLGISEEAIAAGH